MLTDHRQQPPLWVYIAGAALMAVVLIGATFSPNIIVWALVAATVLFLGIGIYIWIGERRFQTQVRRESGTE